MSKMTGWWPWLLLLATTVVGAQPAPSGGERKVLRLAFTRAETSMDPARIVDL